MLDLQLSTFGRLISHSDAHRRPVAGASGVQTIPLRSSRILEAAVVALFSKRNSPGWVTAAAMVADQSSVMMVGQVSAARRMVVKDTFGTC